MKQTLNSSEKYRKNRSLGIGKKYPTFSEKAKNGVKNKIRYVLEKFKSGKL